jgi:cytosine/adenosine deaminase-related metal-dependent hydrolase
MTRTVRADLVLTNAAILDGDGLRAGQHIATANGEIVAVGDLATIEAAETVDCSGLLIAPGFVNAHHHFATGFLRGAPALARPPRNQRERLEQVIWPFERRLTHADVRAAVGAGLLEAIAAGTTTVIDHHVSAGCIPGVLDVIAEAVQASGVRGIVCYEITDRDGKAVAAPGVAENERFLAGSLPERVAGMVGLHAMSTVGPESLTRAVALAERYGTGLHLHLGEAVHDNEDSVSRFGARPVARLDAAGGLTPRTLAAHAIHVTEEEALLLGERGVMVAHLPRSNAANGVGVADLPRLQAAGCLIGLGGDGFTQDIRAELPLAPLLQRQERRDPTVFPPRTIVGIGVKGSARIVERIAGWRVGRVAPGRAADLVALRYEPIAPLLAENALWHLAAGLPGAAVRDVWIDGQAVMRNGAFLTLDAERIRSEAAARFAALWAA